MTAPAWRTRALAASFLLAGVGASLAQPGVPAGPGAQDAARTEPVKPSASKPSPDARDGPAPSEQPSTVPADPKDEEVETLITLINGSRQTGVLLEQTQDVVVLRVAGVPTRFATDSIAEIETLPPVLTRYRQLRAAISDEDIDQRLRLVYWLREHRKYQTALDEVSGILGREPRNPQALQLKTWLEQQMKLAPRPAPRVSGVETAPRLVAGNGAPETRSPEPFALLSPEQINLIRVFEVDLSDPPRMMIDRDVITALINRYSTDPLIPAAREARDAIYRQTPSQILELMFRLRARDFYGRVQVLSDPRSLRLFRERVHSAWLLNSCATTQCHGGEHAGRLALATRQPNSDATVYTNFLILERFRLRAQAAAGGPAAGDNGAQDVGRPLIDYEDPARSPLLHMALPRAESLFPHPQVAAAGGRLKPITPVFSNLNDRRYQDAVEWIRSMYMPRPEYPVNFTPTTPGVQAAVGSARKAKEDPFPGKR